MRTGPGQNYPGTWLYQRRDLPIRVVKIYPNWRMIQDPDGTQGWMLVTLLSDQRTAIVKPGEPRADPRRAPRRRQASATAPSPASSAASSKCGGGWCQIEIGKREGYIRTSDIWGVERRGSGRLNRRGQR